MSEGKDPLFLVESNISYYDQEEIIPNCTVQILTNSVTGDVSVGWWRNDPDEEDEEEM